MTAGKIYAIQFLGPCIELYIPYVINIDTSMVVKRDVWRNKYQVITLLDNVGYFQRSRHFFKFPNNFLEVFLLSSIIEKHHPPTYFLSVFMPIITSDL